MKNQKKTIILSGGGTLGSISPLLALAENLREEYNLYWLVSKQGPEKGILEKNGFSFSTIPSGKLRRYFSFYNFLDPIFIMAGFLKSLAIIIIKRPKLTISAGSFVSVPVVWAAKILGIKNIIHQQDLRPGLANKLMAPAATIITTVFLKSVADFGKKARQIGNPCSLKMAPELGIDLDPDKPVLLVFGGGTGAETLNSLIIASLDFLLSFCQVVHSTGQGKKIEINKEGYFSFEFIDTNLMHSLLAQATAVVSRAGLGALTEISFYRKASIIIPIPHSHQEDNAAEAAKTKGAIILDQTRLTADDLMRAIRKIILDKDFRLELEENIGKLIKPGAIEEMKKIIKELI